MSILSNETLNVASSYHCDQFTYAKTFSSYDPIWRQTAFGCCVLRMFRDLYGFNVSYVPEVMETNLTYISGEGRMRVQREFDSQNRSIDIYIRPVSLGLEHLDCMYPIISAYKWRFGFILRRSHTGFYHSFYSKPFSRPVWNCLYSMALIVSLLLYFIKKWEFGIVGGWECSYTFELLMIIGAYCQHIPPMDATLPSRRIAYFIVFMFAYVVYTFYTSNLLSHLVNDKEHDMNLQNLLSSDIEMVIVDYLMLTMVENIPSSSHNYTEVLGKISKLRSVSVLEGVLGVKEGKMALLSDYLSLLPYAKLDYNTYILCEISNIDLFTNINKFMFTSNKFRYKELFKIGALRAKETGVMNRFRSIFAIEYNIPKCSSNHVQTKFLQISTPIFILLGSYIVSLLILFMETLCYKRFKVWPYVE